MGTNVPNKCIQKGHSCASVDSISIAFMLRNQWHQFENYEFQDVILFLDLLPHPHNVILVEMTHYLKVVFLLLHGWLNPGQWSGSSICPNPFPCEQYILFCSSVAAPFIWSGHRDTLGSRVYGDVLVQSQLRCHVINASACGVPVPRSSEDCSDWTAEHYKLLRTGLLFFIAQRLIWRLLPYWMLSMIIRKGLYLIKKACTIALHMLHWKGRRSLGPIPTYGMFSRSLGVSPSLYFSCSPTRFLFFFTTALFFSFNQEQYKKQSIELNSSSIYHLLCPYVNNMEQSR